MPAAGVRNFVCCDLGPAAGVRRLDRLGPKVCGPKNVTILFFLNYLNLNIYHLFDFDERHKKKIIRLSSNKMLIKYY